MADVKKEIIARPFIDIVMDGPPDHVAPRFIEVEDHEGRSIRIGTWIDRGNGYWALRLSRQELP